MNYLAVSAQSNSTPPHTPFPCRPQQWYSQTAELLTYPREVTSKSGTLPLCNLWEWAAWGKHGKKARGIKRCKSTLQYKIL